MEFDIRKQFHTLVSDWKFHFIPWSRILIAQTAYFPIHGPATDQLNVHRHHSNVSQFSFSLLSLSPIFAFRNLNTASIASGFYHLYSKMYLYNEGVCLEQGILKSLLWETRSQQIWESIQNTFYVHLNPMVWKGVKGRWAPFTWQKMSLCCFHLLHIL